MFSLDKRLIALAMFTAVVSATVTSALMTGGIVRDSSHFSWYAARASGMVAYLLATMSVLFGLATSTQLGQRMLGKANVADVHRVLSLLTLFAIGGHTMFLALDQYASFGLSDLLIPFITWYRPVWTGFGILAAYLTFALYLSFGIRSIIGYRAWRAFHYAAFAVFALGTMHGLFAGTDTSAAWALAIYVSAAVAVSCMLAYRILRWIRLVDLQSGDQNAVAPSRRLSRAVSMGGPKFSRR